MSKLAFAHTSADNGIALILHCNEANINYFTAIKSYNE